MADGPLRILARILLCSGWKPLLERAMNLTALLKDSDPQPSGVREISAEAVLPHLEALRVKLRDELPLFPIPPVLDVKSWAKRPPGP